ncbi:MAG: hypothetical protein J6V06_04865, partial [Clostridia bacterium]|nr:hypothetical protein [Clostridia bacterium]
LEEKYEALSEQRNKHNAEQIDAQKKTVKKELDLAKERARNLAQYKNTLEKQLADFTTLQENYAKDASKIAEDLTNDINAEVDRYEQAFNSRYETIRNSLNLFTNAEKGDSVKGSDLTKALKTQISVLKDYDEVLAELSQKSVNPEFLEELKSLGVNALPQLEAINEMSDKELSKYVELWEEKNALALSATETAMKAQEKESLATIQTLKENAKTELGLLQTSFRTDLITLTEEISAGMKESGEAGLSELAAQIDSYTQIGRDLMSGVAEGISDKESVVIDMLVKGVRRAIEAAKEEADIHSPSDVTKDELGANLALGVGEGWEEKINLVKNTMADSMSALISKARDAVTGEQARYSGMTAPSYSGMNELLQAVGTQTAGINSLASSYRRGSTNMRPVIIELGGREVGRAIVDLGGEEEKRVGAHLSYGGAKK